MGIPITPPIVVDPVTGGDPCVLCWGTDKPFGSGSTPSEITVVISGAVLSPGFFPDPSGDPNGTWSVFQEDFFPCTFKSIDPFNRTEVFFVSGVTTVRVWRGLNRLIWEAVKLTSCSDFLAENQTHSYEHGSAQIHIPEVI